MRILIYGINYAPELTGIGKYTGEMAEWMAQKGHSIHVITAMPYYPKWEKKSTYKGKWWHKEIMEGVVVYRCPLYVPKKVTPISRIFHEFSFIGSSIPVWTKRFFAKKYDVIVSISPPFHLGFLPALYGKMRNCPVITHVQDLQVDVAKDLGMIKNRYFLKMMFAAERFLLKSSKAISTISEGMLNKIILKGIHSSKCLMLPNWVDENVIRPVSKQDSLRTAFGIGQDDKVILYSGSLGAKQGLEDIIEVAKYFKDTPDVTFVIVGSGGMKAKLKSDARAANLKNILFFPLQSYSDMSALLAIADIHLILQRKSASDLVMPSKLSSILAAGGVPIVTAVPGSTIHNLVTKNQMRFVTEPENVHQLARCIDIAINADLYKYSLHARNYAELFLSKDAILKSWEKEIDYIVNGDYGSRTILSKDYSGDDKYILESIKNCK